MVEIIGSILEALPDIETLRYWNQWTMILYRIGALILMLPMTYAALLFIRCARNYLLDD